jgi:hypothetical protein
MKEKDMAPNTLVGEGTREESVKKISLFSSINHQLVVL